MADYRNILYEKRARLAYITINRPDRMNAIDPVTSEELHHAWMDFRDDPEVWVAIITGAGDRAFSAGADLISMAQARSSGRPTSSGVIPFGGMTRHLEIWKPMIAAINGYALAGGLEMALACDLRIAAEHASFGLPEVSRAIIPGAGGTQRLPRAIPIAWAMEILLMGDRISAQDAYRLGLVNRVVPLAELMPTAEKMALRICENGPLAVRAVKEAAWRGLNMSLEQGLALEALFSSRIANTEDAKEGPRAFAEKRPPQYRGR